MACPDENEVLRFLQGTLDEATANLLEAHIDSCQSCRRLLSAWAGSTVARTPTGDPDGDEEDPGSDPQLARGESVGRFVVIDRVGAGGMGVVYAAYDPELDRKVALKFLRTGDAQEDESRGTRLMREAQAMAKLPHPNVVAVYDVGSYRGRVFVAMEFVQGMTLKLWLREATRPWREVVEVFSQAGQGLAAAHRAGIVHRDFKPDNVLISKDDRVQVTDFGLARPLTERERLPADSSPAVMSAPLTLTGEVLGTPGYMAPEQLQGGTADARTDQFSFCVALHEGLYGIRPFDGASFEEIAPNILAGKVQPVSGSSVPAWLRRVMLRGLAANPEKRFATMEELLWALGQDPSTARNRWFGRAALLAAVILAFIMTIWLVRSPAQLCQGSQDSFQSAWGPGSKDRVRRAFLGTKKPFAEDAWRVVERELDAYGRAWVAQHTDACEATHVRGEQSEAALDARMSCLLRRLEDVQALVVLLSGANAEVVASAPKAVHDLGMLDRCRDAQVLLAEIPLPADEAARSEAKRLRSRLSEVRALLVTGRYTDGLRSAAEVAEQAGALGYRPLEGEALLSLGILQAKAGESDEAEKTLYRAVWAAESGRHDEACARAWTELVRVVGSGLARHEEGHRLAAHARAAIERHGRLNEVAARLVYHLGGIYRTQANWGEAAAHYERAEKELAAVLGSAHPLVASAINSRGNVHFFLGEYDQALVKYNRALEVRRQAFGGRHPELGKSHLNIGNIHKAKEDYHLALQSYEQALWNWEGALSPQHPYVAGTHDNMGLALMELGRYKEALEHHEVACAAFLESVGDEHPSLGLALNNTGLTLIQAGRPEEALEKLEQSRDIFVRALGDEHDNVGMPVHNLGLAYANLGRHQLAVQSFRRAFDIRKKNLGADHPEVAKLLLDLGTSLRKLGRREDAAGAWEQSLDVSERALEPSSPLLAGRRFVLAQALWQVGRRSRALQAAKAARDYYIAAGEAHEADRDEVDRWLKEHR